MAKRGPKGAYKRDKIDLEQVELLAGAGFIEKEIAIILNINTETLHEWKKDEKFSTALKVGKVTPDSKVAKSLYKRALGFQYDEICKEYNRAGHIVSTKITTKQVIPDVSAQIFWLKNRRSDIWKDKIDLEHSAPEALVEKFATMTAAELLTKANGLIAGKTPS